MSIGGARVGATSAYTATPRVGIAFGATATTRATTTAIAIGVVLFLTPGNAVLGGTHHGRGFVGVDAAAARHRAGIGPTRRGLSSTVGASVVRTTTRSIAIIGRMPDTADALFGGAVCASNGRSVIADLAPGIARLAVAIGALAVSGIAIHGPIVVAHTGSIAGVLLMVGL